MSQDERSIRGCRLTRDIRKTQIALDYAYRRCYEDPDCSVFWVHADNGASFTEDYRSIARKLGLPESLSGKDLLMGVRAGIEANRHWLLVIDNADNLQLFGVRNALRTGSQDQTVDTTLNLSEFVPRGPVGTVLWISRDKGIESIVGVQRAIEVAHMAEDEGMELLKAAGGLGDNMLEGAAELLAELDCHPLALSQAAAFMRRMFMTIKEYLSRLASREKRWSVLQNSAYDPYRRQGLTNNPLKTWDISVAQLRQENEVAFDMLHILAFLDNQDILFEILYQAATLRSRWITNDRKNNKDDNKNEDANGDDGEHESERSNEDDSKGETEEEALLAIARLQELSFLHACAAESKGRTYKMNKLVQEVILYTLTNEDRRKDQVRYLRLALQILGDLFPNHGLEHWAGWVSLAATYRGQGRYQEAGKINSQALALQRDILGERHPDTMQSMSSLAVIYYEQGRRDKAEELGVKTLALQREILGERHPDTIQSMAILAGICHKRRNYDEVEEMRLGALALQRDILGERHPDTIRSMMNLGIAYRERGRYKEAEELGAKVLALQRDILGERHPETIKGMVNLGVAYRERGRYEEAEKLGVRALALHREVLGERHQMTIWVMVHLALIRFRQQRTSEAVAMMEDCSALFHEMLGADHDFTRTCVKFLESCGREEKKDGNAVKG
ncbi:hypothetical protein CHGG_08091 [Chaetomium globosum CBS 148.51]|uniref:NB-ARC domain-containing protein n=1 Tax=Chaetomium globosum (strain ATCC 6205 / CBS 148.51 / DSM 1962 / NBRC 6347 / NRRL 1970) TaxID=306901 RepID=Q2GVB3_CHAGB|nr:uncharacterized protein CHGG_08091 [Chaetomium globosum CBS 148.51]EAQ86838.1 hypothetical protein CHGG_08091 [Chaetomium globosum CBS 148.51]